MRKVFYSFHYNRDSVRVSQVKNMGVVEGQPLLSANKWEEVENKGDSAIKDWIDAELKGKSCLVVLIGAQTAGRKWINYEITQAWNAGKGVLGVHIHNLKDFAGATDNKGKNPFDSFTVGSATLSSLVKVYDPPASTAYANISANLSDWVEAAISARQ